MTHAHKTAFLGEERIFPLLLKLAVPAAVAMLVNAIYNIVDTIFVGLGVGSLAIAALSIVFPIQMIASALAQAIGVGAGSIVSRRLGEKHEEDAARTIGTAYSAVTLSTLILVSALFAFTKPILTFFGASEEVMPFAIEYTLIVAAGFFFFALSMTASSLIRAEGNAKASMIGMMIGAVLNCVLDPLFIFAFGWGVAGAAWATVISQAASCAYLFGLYALKRNHIHLRKEHFRIRTDLLRESAVLGLPSFVQAAGLSLLALLINTTLGAMGGDRAITIYGMDHRFLTLIIFPIIGVAQAFQPIVGYNFGARRFDRVRKAIRVTIATTLGVSSFFFAFTMLFPAVCLGMFTTDKQLAADAAEVLRLMVMFIPLVAVQFVGSTYFQAVGKQKESLVLGIARQFLILIPLMLILPRFLGLNGVWLSFPTADFLSSALTAGLLFAEARHLKQRHAETEDAAA